LGAAGHGTIVNVGRELTRQGMEIIGLDLLQNFGRVGEGRNEIKEPGRDRYPVLKRYQLTVLQLSTGVLETMGGHDQVTQVDRTTNTRADTRHDDNTRLPDAQSLCGGDRGGRQTLLELRQSHDPEIALTPNHISKQIGRSLAIAPLELKPRHLLNPLELFVQSSQQENVCATFG